MCGIAGIWNKEGKRSLEPRLQTLVRKMRHRGPDAEGVWSKNNLALGHSRLKIIDLSNNANQPFTDGNDVLVFNGEIFNFMELKKKLPGNYVYKTSSDTEVLFRALQCWGVDALKKIDGQFAFAFYDDDEKSLMLARDHVGICPLYTMENDNEIIFASEIRPILELNKSPIDPQGVLDYFSYRYNIQNGHTLFANIKRFHPANYWLIDLINNKIKKKRYWRLRFNKENYNNNNIQETFNELFDSQVKVQTISDVPIGIYLSGGIDSGALLSGFSKVISPINSFSLEFSKDDEDINRVNALNRKIPFNKNIIPFNQQSLDTIEDVIFSLEEPFGDLIICANYLLANYASRSVKVVLSGEGGDEAFMGYDHQRAFMKMLSLGKSVNNRFMINTLLKIIPSSLLSIVNTYPGGFGSEEQRRIQETFRNITTPVDAYLNLVKLFNDKELNTLFLKSFLSNAPDGPDRIPLDEIFHMDNHIWQSIMRSEIEQLILIVNLLKQERLAMRFSLEGRVPLVSRKVLEFAASLPIEKLFGGINKEYLVRYSGSNIIRKKPFSVFAHKEYKKMLIILMDKYADKQSVYETGILSWEYVEQLRNSINRGGLIVVKKAMVVLVFLIWWKKYSVPYKSF